jgi:hypothetical protein
MAKGKATDKRPCRWISRAEAFRSFATHKGGVQSAQHIKPLHWYIATRLVLEGGFDPKFIKPRPPFETAPKGGKKGKRTILMFKPEVADWKEQVILGGLKTKNVDVVVTNPELGPVLAISCKGVTKAFRNLTNRMEDTIGECTNLHITYPALVLGYLVLLRANRTVQDAREAPAPEETEDSATEGEATGASDDALAAPANETSTSHELTADTLSATPASVPVTPEEEEQIKANDIAILESGEPTDSIKRFHAALSQMTRRHGIREEISRYEAMALAMIEPKGDQAGSVVPGFPLNDSPLHFDRFFSDLYQRYEERFVFGASILDERGITGRYRWAEDSPVFENALALNNWPILDFEPRKRR